MSTTPAGDVLLTMMPLETKIKKLEIKVADLEKRLKNTITAFDKRISALERQI